LAAEAGAFAAAGLPPDSVDAVLMTAIQTTSRVTVRHRTRARNRACGDVDTLQSWLHAARRVLRPRAC